MKIFLYFSLLSILIIQGCDSTDNSHNKSNSDDKSAQVTLGSYKINVEKEEQFILGAGCTSVTINDYNNTSNIVATNNGWLSSDQMFSNNSLNLKKGTYIFSYNRNGARTLSATGVLYSFSSKIRLEEVPLNERISIPGNSSNLYKLELTETTPLSLSINNGSISLYNSSLKYIENSKFSSRSNHQEISTLDRGIYYILSSSYTSFNNCASGSGGSFSITKL